MTLVDRGQRHPHRGGPGRGGPGPAGSRPSSTPLRRPGLAGHRGRRRRPPRRDPAPPPAGSLPPVARRAAGRAIPGCGMVVESAPRRRCCPSWQPARSTPPCSPCRSTTPSWASSPLFAEDLVPGRAGRPPARRPHRRSRWPSWPSTASCCRRRAPRCGPTSRPRRPGPACGCEPLAEIDGVRLIASLAFDGHGAAHRAGHHASRAIVRLRQGASRSATCRRARSAWPAAPGGPARPRRPRRARHPAGGPSADGTAPPRASHLLARTPRVAS